MDKLKDFFVTQFGYRVPILLVFIFALFNFDLTVLGVVGFSLGFLFCQALASHLLRKILFPYLDMEEFFNKAKENAISASITIFAVCMVLSALIISASDLWTGARLGG